MILYIATVLTGIGLAIYSNNKLKIASGLKVKTYANMWNTSLVIMASSILGSTAYLAFSKVYDDDLVFVRSLGAALLMAILLSCMLTLVLKSNARVRQKMMGLYDLRGVVVKATNGKVQKVRLYRDEDTVTVNGISGDFFKNGDHVQVVFATGPKSVHVSHIGALPSVALNF